jgi:hypothetical protein
LTLSGSQNYPSLDLLPKALKLTDNPTGRQARLVSKPFLFLVAVSILHAIGLFFFAMRAPGQPAPDGTQLVVQFLWRLIVPWWLYVDRQALRVSGSYEFGAFAFFAWPVVLPYYLFCTRAWRGLLLYLAFAGLGVLPYLAPAIIGAFRTTPVHP